MRNPQDADVSWGFEMRTDSTTTTAAMNPFTFTTFAAQVGPKTENVPETGKWHANGNGGSTFMDVFVDAVVAGGSAAFAVLVAAPGLPDTTKAWAAFVAFGVTVFASLGAARRRPKRRRSK